MLNKKPIIINGYSRGGTNILLNILLSHPGTASPSGELHSVFKGGGIGYGKIRNKFKQYVYDYPVRLMCGDVFNRFSYHDRGSIPEMAMKYIDFVLWIEKQFASHESHNKWKDKNNLYTRKERRDARLVVKAHSGLIFLNHIFRKMYDDARFVAVVRNGYAVCEGLMRRGRTIEEAVELYNAVGNEIARNAVEGDYLIVKFEDIITNYLEGIERIYQHCHLQTEECIHFRFQHKPLAAKGTKKAVLYGDYDRQLVWLARHEIKNFFKLDVNTNQIERLSSNNRIFLDNHIRETMRKLGY